MDQKDKPSKAGTPNGHQTDKRALSPKNTVTASPTNSPQGKQQKMDQKQTERNIPSPAPFIVAASPPTFVSFEEIMKAANGVANMALAHEIAVENDFSFQKSNPVDNRYLQRIS